MAQFSLVINGDFEAVTAFIDGELMSANNDHPRFKEIVQRLRNDELDGISALFDPEQAIRNEFAKITDQVSIRAGVILYEGEPVNNSLGDMIVRLWDQGEGYEAFAKFLEKLYQNPNEHSREMLFDWLQAGSFTIREDGNFVGYKGVKVNDKGEYVSIHAGDGIVDGVEYKNTQLPNHPGAMVEMPRADVTFDPSSGCAQGLHVGTWRYANSFARGAVLEVSVNPRDVVSVPAYEHEKLRACRYRVVDVIEKQYEEAYVSGSAYDDPEDDECPGGDDCWCDDVTYNEADDQQSTITSAKVGETPFW